MEKKRLVGGVFAFIICIYFALSGIAFLYAEEELGINKNQPISVNGSIYKSRCGNNIYSYSYEGIDNNALKIKEMICPQLPLSGTEHLKPDEAIKKITNVECDSRVESLSLLGYRKETLLLVIDGIKLLIRVVDNSNRIIVNEMVVKTDPNIKYDKKWQDRRAWEEVRQYKPVIYLYPTKKQSISVRLEYQGNIVVSYPKYDYNLKGWKVTATPDGRIIDSSDKEEYSYIFWEGVPAKEVQYDFSKGFIVEGEKAATFLRDTLKRFGLTPKEYNEFIVYWFPKLKNNKYNLIHFAGAEYENIAKLDITPQPDSILRIFMVFKPIDQKIDIEPQEIKYFTRSGFTVIEWGGTELK